MEFKHQKLKQCREAANKTIIGSVVAFTNAGIDVSPNTVRSWEEGRTSPSAQQLGLIAKLYKKSVGFFYTK